MVSRIIYGVLLTSFVAFPCSLAYVPQKLPTISPARNRLPVNVNALATDVLLGSTPKALLALVIPTFVGIKVEENLLPDSSILVSLIVGAILGRVVPHQHGLYNACWTLFLPGSLALLLLAIPSRSNVQAANMETDSYSAEEESVGRAIRRVAIPFFISSVASIIGCIMSFGICYAFRLLPRKSAAIATACQTASFVGGSVNFLATARGIATAGDAATASLVSSMATADLVVTAIYFAILSWAQQSRVLARWYGNSSTVKEAKAETPTENRINCDDSVSPTAVESMPNLSRKRYIWDKVIDGSLVSLLGFAIVSVANRMEVVTDRVSGGLVPGTACAFIILLSPLVRKLCEARTTVSRIWNRRQRTASNLSNVYFLFLFASIGVQVDVQAALATGPACLIISGFALLVHLIGTLSGTMLIRRFWFREEQMDLPDVLVGSNAAIGGPATAAAFCRSFPGSRQRALTYAATVWGVVGYAVGTTIGIAFYRGLARSFL